MLEKAKEGVLRRLKVEPFANSRGGTSMNKIQKTQEPCGGPRKRKQVMYSNIFEA